ncbi:MAG: sulfatase-like hydrolase/transferase, partial [Planctomycetota bacterium]
PALGVVLLVALVTTVVDCVFMQKKWTIFTGGYLNPSFLEGAEIPMFLFGSFWLDAAAAALFVAPALWLTALLARLGRPRRLLLAALICFAPIEAILIVNAKVHRYLGDSLQYSGLFVSANAATLGMGVLVLVTVALALLLYWLCGRVPDRWVGLFYLGPRSRRGALALGAALVLGAPVMLAVVGGVRPDLQRQFIRKGNGGSFARFGEWVTDVDRDGVGLVWQPSDQAPFDARRHPFAVDLPANGIDENGIHGDLEARGDFSHEYFPPVDFVQNPDVVLFVLESYRSDNLTATEDGRPIAPNLRRLVDEGGITGPAYTHAGFTVPSLVHTFTGSLSGTVEDSLIDDFNANGYLTACISGEDEDFGGIETLTGMVRAEHFVDARSHLNERYSVLTSAESLAVPWTVVVRDVETFLRKKAGNGRPVFLYVNLQDCHFPYHHAALQPMLQNRPVSRSEITTANAARIRRTYRNSAANVDHAVGRILDSWTSLRGRPPAVVVVGDHGEGLYEDGALGHGIGIDREMTQIPFIVSGLPADCVFPLGLADVRAVLRDALTRHGDRPTASTDPEKWVWQFVGPLRGPRLFGAAFANGGIVYDRREEEYRTWGDPPRRAPFRAAVRLWEQIQVRRDDAALRTRGSP